MLQGESVQTGYYGQQPSTSAGKHHVFHICFYSHTAVMKLLFKCYYKVSHTIRATLWIAYKVIQYFKNSVFFSVKKCYLGFQQKVFGMLFAFNNV